MDRKQELALELMMLVSSTDARSIARMVVTDGYEGPDYLKLMLAWHERCKAEGKSTTK
jgi:hypothetical protein